MTVNHNVPHPGEVLRDWLDGITVTEAAARLGVTRITLSRVLNGAAGISPDMDLRLAKALNTTPGFWYAMQCDHDMWRAQRCFRAKVRQINCREVTAGEYSALMQEKKRRLKHHIEHYWEITRSFVPDSILEIHNLAHEIRGSHGGKKAKGTKQIAAKSSKEKAAKRFKALIATGDRDANDAMKLMMKEGWSRSTLYRHLREELARIGRGMQRPVKRHARKNTSVSQSIR